MTFDLFVKDRIAEGFTTKEEAQEFASQNGFNDDEDRHIIVEEIVEKKEE